jgi:hypothetical protein
MANITGLMVSVIVVGMILSGLVLFMGDLSNNYTATYDDSSIDIMIGKMNETRTTATNIKSGVTNIKSDDSLFDIIGSFFTRAYSSFVLTFQSFDVLDDIIKVGGKEIGASSFFVDGLVTIILIIIFVGIVLYALIKVR